MRMGMRTIGLVVALALAGCSQGPQQRTYEQCRTLWANSQALSAQVAGRLQSASEASEPMTQNQLLVEAQITESRWQAVSAVMLAGNCCAYDDTCIAAVSPP